MSNIGEVHSKAKHHWSPDFAGQLFRNLDPTEGIQKALHVMKCLDRLINVIFPNGTGASGAAAGAQTISSFRRPNKAGACRDIKGVSVYRFHRTGPQTGLIYTGIAG